MAEQTAGAKREAYEKAVEARNHLIDNPDKTITVDAYRAKLKAAFRKVDTTHAAWAKAMDLEPKQTRSKGDGGLYKQADGLWACTVELPPDQEGRRRRKTMRGKDRGTVQRKLTALKLQLADSGDMPTASMTAEKWFTHWIDDIEPRTDTRPSTIRGYRSVINGFIIPAVGKKKLEQLSAQDVRAVHDLVMATPKPHPLRGRAPEDWPAKYCTIPDADGKHEHVGNHEVPMLSSTYALLAHNAMSASLKAAYREGLVRSNVCDKVDRPRPRVTAQAALELEEAIQVLAYCATIPDGPLWASYLLTGARRGELLGLECERVDGDLDLSWQLQRVTNLSDAAADYEKRHLVKSLYLTRPKSNAGWRVLPLVEPLRSILKLAVNGRKTGLVFTDRGAPWDPDAATDRWKEVLAGAGIERTDVVLHGSRHTAVDLLYAAGVDEDLVQDIVGHSTVAMTRKYRTKSKLQRARLEAALKQMSELVGGSSSS